MFLCKILNLYYSNDLHDEWRVNPFNPIIKMNLLGRKGTLSWVNYNSSIKTGLKAAKSVILGYFYMNVDTIEDFNIIISTVDT